MLVSGRKSRGARLAGRSRLANTRDRMRMETKSPARKGCHSRQGRGPGNASRALAKSCSLYGESSGERAPQEWAEAQHGSLWAKLARDRPSRVRVGCYACHLGIRL